KALRQHFILEKLAEVENIEADPQDYEIEISRIAEQMGETPRRLRAQLERSGEMDILHNQIIERKVLDMIQEEAKITDGPYDSNLADNEEALDMSATGADESEEIPEATEEDAKAAARELAEKKHQ
ncbi:MAG: trigger factor, partial [Planctomycetia bacterium]|nr:trigger factor [Planctomycetia bacterium]